MLGYRLLIKALARVIKVEKNNESVVNCQQLLSTRLDKVSQPFYVDMCPTPPPICVGSVPFMLTLNCVD